MSGQAGDFAHGVARVQDAAGQPYYCIDRTGKRAPEELVGRLESVLKLLQKNREGRGLHEGLSASWGKVTTSGSDVGKNKKGYVDRTGKFVIPPRYDEAYNFSEGLAVVSRNGKFGFIDRTGKVVIPLKYGAARSFSEGVAAVRLSVEEARAAGLPWSETGWTPWGYIDRTGKFVLSDWFSEAQPFSAGVAYVSQYYVTLEGFRGFIDHAGTRVLDMRSPAQMKPVDPNHMPIPKDH